MGDRFTSFTEAFSYYFDKGWAGGEEGAEAWTDDLFGECLKRACGRTAGDSSKSVANWRQGKTRMKRQFLEPVQIIFLGEARDSEAWIELRRLWVAQENAAKSAKASKVAPVAEPADFTSLPVPVIEIPVEVESLPDAQAVMRAQVADIFEKVSLMAEQGRTDGVSPAAVRNYLERALREGFTKGDIISWLPGWLEQARVAVNSGGNEDDAFRQAITEAKARLGQDRQSNASQPIMDNLAKIRARAKEAAQEALRVQRKHIEAAIEFDELELNIDGVVEKLFVWAEIEGCGTGTALYDFLLARAGAYNKKTQQAPTSTPLLIVRELFKTILHRLKEELSPRQIAGAHNNLGIITRRLGAGLGGQTGLDALAEARDLHEAALRVFIRDVYPREWAMARHGLGLALQDLGYRLDPPAGIKVLFKARTTLQDVLEVWTPEASPGDWAMAQNNLAITLRKLGQRVNGDGTLDLYREAEARFTAVLKVWTRRKFPARWATTQNNLGTLFNSLGELLEGDAATDALTRARVSFYACLKVQTRQAFPYDWAKSQGNLAIVAETFFKKTGDRMYLGDGVKAARKALRVFRQMKTSYDVEQAESLLSDLQVLLNAPA